MSYNSAQLAVQILCRSSLARSQRASQWPEPVAVGGAKSHTDRLSAAIEVGAANMDEATIAPTGVAVYRFAYRTVHGPSDFLGAQFAGLRLSGPPAEEHSSTRKRSLECNIAWDKRWGRGIRCWQAGWVEYENTAHGKQCPVAKLAKSKPLSISAGRRIARKPVYSGVRSWRKSQRLL